VFALVPSKAKSSRLIPVNCVHSEGLTPNASVWQVEFFSGNRRLIAYNRQALVALVLAGAIEFGRLTAIYFRIHEDENRKEQILAIRDALFVLLSLLLGFTLAVAAPAFAERRALFAEEEIDIRTAYLRAGTLPGPYREHSQQLLREYVDDRLDLDDAELDGFFSFR
jgi:hypothetical protein